MSNYLSFIGLCFDILGALLILSGAYLSRAKALDVGVMRLSPNTAEEKLKLPSVANLISQSRSAVLGTASLLAGFVLQAVAVWPF